MATLLYFDTNVLCRPFDDQTIRRIRKETEVFERILEKIRAKEAAFITSDISFLRFKGLSRRPREPRYGSIFAYVRAITLQRRKR